MTPDRPTYGDVPVAGQDYWIVGDYTGVREVDEFDWGASLSKTVSAFFRALALAAAVTGTWFLTSWVLGVPDPTQITIWGFFGYVLVSSFVRYRWSR